MNKIRNIVVQFDESEFSKIEAAAKRLGCPVSIFIEVAAKGKADADAKARAPQTGAALS